MQFITEVEFFPGDWVKTWFPKPGVWHHGIARSVVHLTGPLFVVQVAHNMKFAGVGITDLFEFSEGLRVVLHDRPSPEQVPAILSRVDSSLGSSYHLFAQNCEHFASYAFTGQAESTTVRTGLALTVVGAIFVGLLSSEG